jgi:hypothetical protein
LREDLINGVADKTWHFDGDHKVSASKAATRNTRGPFQPALLPDAKPAEYQVQDVVGRGRAGDFVQRFQGVVEIEQDHLMRDAVVRSGAGGVQGTNRILNKSLMAGIGQKSGFSARTGVAGKVAENGIAEFGNTLTGRG